MDRIECPYYKGETGNTIMCEGERQPCFMTVFDDKEHKSEHKAVFCDSASNCTNCRTYNSVKNENELIEVLKKSSEAEIETFHEYLEKMINEKS